jgi:hypothetical protein
MAQRSAEAKSKNGAFDRFLLGRDYEAGLDEVLVSFCTPTFSVIWRIPRRETQLSDE